MMNSNYFNSIIFDTIDNKVWETMNKKISQFLSFVNETINAPDYWKFYYRQFQVLSKAHRQGRHVAFHTMYMLHIHRYGQKG